jgi:putative colanic acid biosynthesis acetyltransferase WcaF
MSGISIGDRTVVSQGTKLITGTHDHSDPGFRLIARDISVGDDVWLASDVFVCPGVTIASGAVVGARSVVTRDVPGWKISAGNPCRPVKDRRMKGEKKDA